MLCGQVHRLNALLWMGFMHVPFDVAYEGLCCLWVPFLKSKQLLPSAVYQKAVVHNSFRFFDCDAHFTNPSINALV